MSNIRGLLVLFLGLIAAPSATAAGDATDPTVVRVPLGSFQSVELKSRKAIRDVLNAKGELLWRVKYARDKDGQVTDVLISTDEENRGKEDDIASVQLGSAPNTVNFWGRTLGSTRRAVIDEDGKKEPFRIDVYRSYFVFVDRSLRLQTIPPKKLKRVEIGKTAVLEGHVSPLNAEVAVVTARDVGISPLTLVAEDGSMEKLEVYTRTDKPKDGERTIVIAARETRKLEMDGKAEIGRAVNEDDRVAELQPSTEDARSLRLTARHPGRTRISLTNSERKTEEFLVIVTDPIRFLLVGRSIQLANDFRTPLRGVNIDNGKVVRTALDPKNPGTVTIMARESGDARIILTGEDGGKDVFDLQVRSDKPEKGRIIVPRFSTHTLSMSGKETIASTANEQEAVLRISTRKDGHSVGLIGQTLGVSTVTLTSAPGIFTKSKTEKFEVVVVEPKGKENRAKEPIRVAAGDKFSWNDINYRNFERFHIEDDDIVTCDLRGGRDGIKFSANRTGKTTLSFVRDDDGNRDVVEVIVSDKKE